MSSWARKGFSIADAEPGEKMAQIVDTYKLPHTLIRCVSAEHTVLRSIYTCKILSYGFKMLCRTAACDCFGAAKFGRPGRAVFRFSQNFFSPSLRQKWPNI